MLAIGIDPGTAITGYGLVRQAANGALLAVHWGVILTPPKLPAGERLAQIFTSLNDILTEFHPETAAVESLFFQRNVRTAMSVGQARGVVLLALEQAGISVHDYNPNQVKQAISGYGGADKRQVQNMVQMLLKMDEQPKPDDVADALAVAICHLNTLRTAQTIARGS